MSSYEVVAGWTAPIDISLYSRGATPSGTMSGYSVALILRDQDGNAVTTSGDVSIQDSTNWIVRYSPDADDLVPGVYRGRVKVTDGSGFISYFPSGEWDNWIVRSES